MKEELCDLKVNINGQQTFFLSQKLMSGYSGRLRKTIKQEKKRTQVMRLSALKIVDFPGGAEGFELVARFCYNGGRIQMSPSNICLLHSCAAFLEMTEEVSVCNLLSQAETFLDGLFYWTWNDILASLKASEGFLLWAADSSGLLQKLVSALLAKISSDTEMPAATMAPLMASSSSSSSSPDTSAFRFSSSTKTPDTIKPCLSREWWFDDLTILHPRIIEVVMKTLGAYGEDNKNLILTRFLLHYLKTVAQRPGGLPLEHRSDCGGLADTAVHGAVLVGRTAFSCRGLFWVLRVVSGLGLSRECRHKLERVIGMNLDQATLDDLLVSGGHDGAVYDVNLVLRLVRVFVNAGDGGVPPLQRMKKVGKLLDKYLGEISPDQSLKVSKFLGIAESLPDSARDCFDGVYRALDIYLESHPALSSEDRSRLCRCLNYEKLTLETCRDLAKNPRIPPRAAVQALLVSQQSKLQAVNGELESPWPAEAPRTTVYYKGARSQKDHFPSPQPSPSPSDPMTEDKEELRLNLQRMQWRVVELEKVCKEMRGQMTRMQRKPTSSSSCPSPYHYTGRGLPRLC